MMSEEQLVRARRKEAQNRKTFRFMIIGLPVLLAAVCVFAVADSWRVPKTTTSAMVLALKDTWTLKHGQRCVTTLRTQYGDTSIWTKGTCRNARWVPGQTASVEVQVFRLTHFISVSTGTGLFARAHGLPVWL